VKVDNVSVVHANILNRIFGMDDVIIADVELFNNSPNTFVSTKKAGSVFMSYHWVNQEGKVVVDGIRTALPKPILPGTSEKMSVVSRIPVNAEELSLKLSPVQEGCTWFYMRNPDSGQNIGINVKEKL
ncbi:TPA: hypothetical protein ACJTDP_003788, partial [Yersinia enterocolitica]